MVAALAREVHVLRDLVEQDHVDHQVQVGRAFNSSFLDHHEVVAEVDVRLTVEEARVWPSRV